MSEEQRKARSNNYVIVTLNKPVVWSRDDNENWLLNPPRRYIVTGDHIKHLQPYVENISDLKTSRKYVPLLAGVNLAGKRVLIERCRDRGIGDMLFMTGPMNYLQHVTGHGVKIDMYGLTDRSQILHQHPALAYGTVLAGPVHYDDLSLYDYHWFVDSVTEFDEEKDQLNVYDALYRQIGLDPVKVDPRFKRPSINLTEVDAKKLDGLFYFIFNDKKCDLRHEPYYVVAPLSHSNLRTANYSMWLNVISVLAEQRPTLIVGHYNEGRMPTTDMAFGTFVSELSKLSEANNKIINLMGSTPIRLVMSLIGNSRALIGLDSAPLYIAQAQRVPAVSLWGTHNPTSRIGYDRAYMDFAIWNPEACPASPCYAYAGFPANKCPSGESQRVCEVLLSVNPDQIFEKVQAIEKGAFSA